MARPLGVLFDECGAAVNSDLAERWLAEGSQGDLERRLPGRMPGHHPIDAEAHGEGRFSEWPHRVAARDCFETPEGATPLQREAETIDALYLSGIGLAIVGAPGRARPLGLAGLVRSGGRSRGDGRPLRMNPCAKWSCR